MSPRANSAGQRRQLRTCIGCKKVSETGRFLRIGLGPEGKIGILSDGPTQGRSAYVCRNLECVARALRKDALRRALRRNVSEEEQAEIQRKADCILR